TRRAHSTPPTQKNHRLPTRHRRRDNLLREAALQSATDHFRGKCARQYQQFQSNKSIDAPQSFAISAQMQARLSDYQKSTMRRSPAATMARAPRLSDEKHSLRVE